VKVHHEYLSYNKKQISFFLINKNEEEKEEKNTLIYQLNVG